MAVIARNVAVYKSHARAPLRNDRTSHPSFPCCCGSRGVWRQRFRPRVCNPFPSADPCPDLQVVFARGTDDPPGVGPTGQAFIDSLRPRVGAKSLDVYSVNYPATHEPEPPLLWSPRL